MFSFSRLHGVDPMLGVEMASTGEVGCLGVDLHEALLQSLTATGFRAPERGVLLSLGPLADKFSFADEARVIAEELRLPIYATPGTAEMLREVGVGCTAVGKTDVDGGAVRLLDQGLVDLVINVPREYDSQGRPDGFAIRRRAVEGGVPLFTDLQLARALIEALRLKRDAKFAVRAWDEYLMRPPEAGPTLESERRTQRKPSGTRHEGGV
jgi:carbamoyl-phosphate synthase large subunit